MVFAVVCQLRIRISTLCATVYVLCVLSIIAPTVQGQVVEVTPEIACTHLFLLSADSPRGPSLDARLSTFKDSHLTPGQVKLVLQAANSYVVALTPLDSQAKSIHSALKAKTMPQASGVAALKQLDQKRSAVLSDIMSKLETALGPDAWTQFQDFLEQQIKPNIVTGP